MSFLEENNEARIRSRDGMEFLDAFKPSTRKVYRSALRVFLAFYREMGRGETLEDFLDAVEEDRRKSRRGRRRVARNVLKEFVRWLREREYAPKSVRTYVTAVQSLGGYYGFRLSTRYVDLPSRQPTSDKYPWTLEEVGDFIGDMKGAELKAIAATIVQSGISLGDVLSLTWGDIKREYRRGVVPLCLDFTRQKTDVPFMTFLGSWGTNLLREHLKHESGHGRVHGEMEDDQPLYTMHSNTVEYHFRELAEKRLGDWDGQNPMRPHSLRTAFRTFLGDAGLNETYIEFFMGHKLAEQKRVYINKTREGWRATYKEYEEYLDPCTM